LFVATDNEITEHGLDLHEKRFALELVTCDERRSAACRQIQYMVAGLRTSAQRLLVERDGLLRRMFIFAAVEAFTEPQIDQIQGIVDGTVATADFFVQDFIEVLHTIREVGLPFRAVDAGFIGFRESDLRSHVRVVLHPEACTSVFDARLPVELLEKPDVLLIAPEEVVSGYPEKTCVYNLNSL